MELGEFQDHLKNKQPSEIVQRYLFDFFPYCFTANPSLYQVFRGEICNNFNIHPQNFTIIGSAKLGFSLNSDKFGSSWETSQIKPGSMAELLFGAWSFRGVRPKVLRGGSWINNQDNARCANRNRNNPENRNNNVGFRCSRT